MAHTLRRRFDRFCCKATQTWSTSLLMGSTDNTRHVLDRYRSSLGACISEPDRGQSDALNKGFRLATGDILAWLNSDDLYLPNTLQAVAEAFDRHDTDMVVGGALITQGHSRAVAATHHCVLRENEVVPLPFDQIADFHRGWQTGSFFYQPEVFWSRRIWEKAGACVRDDLNFAMDYELWCRFARLGVAACHVPDFLAIFRRHDTQKTKWGIGEQYPEHAAVSHHYLGKGIHRNRPRLGQTAP